MVVALAK